MPRKFILFACRINRFVGQRSLASEAVSKAVSTHAVPAGTALVTAYQVNRHTDILRPAAGANGGATAGLANASPNSAKLAPLNLPSAYLPPDHVANNTQRFSPLDGRHLGGLEGRPADLGLSDATQARSGGRQMLEAGDNQAPPGYWQHPGEDHRIDAGYTPEWVDARVKGREAVQVGPEFHLSSGLVGSKDWQKLHPQTGQQLYHDARHSETVGQAHGRVVQALGETDPRLIARAEQIGFAHDLDPDRAAGSPPKVSNTIEVLREDFSGRRKLLDGGQRSLTKDEFGWSRQDLNIAETQILRTDFPFDATRQDAYREALLRLRKEGMSDRDLRKVMQEAAALSEVSDKASTYFTKPFWQALGTTHGLALEIGNGMTADKLKPHEFLDLLERPDYSVDAAIARTMGIEFVPPDITRLISSEEMARLRENRQRYQEMFGGTN